MEKPKPSDKSHCYKKCANFRCFCDIGKKQDADTKHLVDEIENVLNAFEETLPTSVLSESYSKPMNNLNSLEIKSRNCVSFKVYALRKNKSILSYLLNNLIIPLEDPLIILTNLNDGRVSFLCLHNILMSNYHSANAYESLPREFKIRLEKQTFFIIKALCNIFLLVSNPNHLLKNNKIVLYQKPSVNGNQNYHKIFNLCQCYFLLHKELSNLEYVNVKLINKIKYLEVKLHTISEEYEAVKFCKVCPGIKEELQKAKENYNGILKNFSNAQAEKERMVMKYATSERRLLEAQKLIKQTEKKHQDALLENATLQKKLQKANENISKLNGEINSKYSEITQLRNQIEHHKTNDNAKEMKLKWAQNRLKIVTDAVPELQKKLNEALARNTELAAECEMLRSQTNDKEQQARLILERHDAEKSEIERLRLQQEFEAKLNEAVRMLEEERKTNQGLRSELIERDCLRDELKSLKEHMESLKTEQDCLLGHNESLRADIQNYKQREIDRLDFTEKLTNRNVQLTCQLEDLQARCCAFERSQSPLHSNIKKLREKVISLDQDLKSEKTARAQECDLLAKCVAEQALYNRKLLHRLEDLEGENLILRKRYDLAIREMSRELNLQQTKTSSRGGSNENIESEEKYIKDKMDDILEKEKLFDQIIKLQKINVKRAEKLDFLEEHSHALLEELQMKTKMLQKYGNHEKKKIMLTNHK